MVKKHSGRPIEIEVPPSDGHSPAGPDSETHAVAEHAEFRAMLEEGRHEREAGGGTPAADFFQELELPLDEEVSPQQQDRTSNGRPVRGAPTPAKGQNSPAGRQT